MKNNLFKITGYIALAAMVIVLPGCLKENKATYTDFSQIGETVILQNAGLGNFRASNVNPGAADTVRIDLVVQYNAEYATASDINITLAVDDAKRTAYNTANTKSFQLMTTNMYKILSTKLLIKAGQRIASTKVEIYTAPINAAPSDISWMLPISITDASGKPLTANYTTMYVNVIGNPLAGDYRNIFSRWNYTGGVAWTGPPAALGLATGLDASNNATPYVVHPGGAAATFFWDDFTTFSAVDGQTITGLMGNVPDPAGGGALYLVTANAAFTAITYDFPSTFTNGYSNIDKYVRGYRAPSPTQKAAFRLVTKYNNTTGGAGNDRLVDETFIHL
jgi:hypothetical protein